MTDNEIIKALECCAKNSENAYFRLMYQGEPLQVLLGNTLDLINRQKAEIERLHSFETYRHCRAKAIKEFIKRFEKKIKDVKFTIGQSWEIQSALKEVEKEMVGDKNEG